MIFSLVIGDWSDDGHGKTRTVEVESKFSSQEFIAAFQKGIKQIDPKCNGHELPICQNYQDSKVPIEFVAGLRKCGLNPDDYLEYYNGTYGIWSDTFANLWLAIAKLGNSELEYEIVHGHSIRIGGYGLFE
jgi:hypothetical protein